MSSSRKRSRSQRRVSKEPGVRAADWKSVVTFGRGRKMTLVDVTVRIDEQCS